MKEKEFLSFRDWFHRYVSSFYTDDDFIQQNVMLKEGHSVRVCDNASLITKAEKLADDDLYLAKTIALFHDIGRFEQINKYRTFRDTDSENHALLGVNILKTEEVISGLKDEEQKIILTAIRNHNVHILPSLPDRRTLLHCKIIRDADKLDIYKVLTDYFIVKADFPNPALDLGLPDSSEYSRDLLQDILNNRVASTKNVKTCNDMNLTRLSWIFDMNFIETIRLVRERDYIGKIVTALPQNYEIAEIRIYLEKYMNTILEGR
ncbi:HD domain-containing protein [Methanococcoides burtonii]|uniref:Metal dependent phosphohydrolase n=1 Tax=Methanococcoides burtonii (strain DSM 6242 / NBRC 107633 / OCM 468 / ACE-M) TaxID=259564 RepID=Q12X96_METBU|nr:HD domain-containing protein [Methanococcoides burtonii]ABE51930.1 metal dependent phosphohydrolase [Methanococcoides burtonii DSM 6242]